MIRSLIAALALLASILINGGCRYFHLEHSWPHAERAIAYQILQQENPFTITTVRSVLEKNPWYETRWRVQLDKLPESERDKMLFMFAARWADDIRTLDKAESRLPWHYVDFPFKPEAEPANIQAMQPPEETILTAVAESERVILSGSEPARQGIALSWLSPDRRRSPAAPCCKVVLAGVSTW